MKQIVYFDFEVSNSGKILDIGAINQDGATFHSAKISDFLDFISSADYLCGHNILSHDLKYISSFLKKTYTFIDTLYFSPILFPERPYHNLVKDEKIISEQLNNPLSDALKAKKLFEDEASAFNKLSENIKRGYYDLLNNDYRFIGFFKYIDYSSSKLSYIFNSRIDNLSELLKGLVCANCEIGKIADEHPIELAYALAIIRTGDRYSITPKWVSHTFPIVENILYLTRGKNCHSSNCSYCSEHFNSTRMLKRQQSIVQGWVKNNNLP